MMLYSLLDYRSMFASVFDLKCYETLVRHSTGVTRHCDNVSQAVCFTVDP